MFYQYFIHQSDQKIINRLDAEEYDESELMEVKIPLHLPYMTSQVRYERVDGELQHEGVYYNYVKRKVSNDTLYLLCVPNGAKTSLYKDLTEYAQKVNDIPGSGKNANASIRKMVLANEYVPHLSVYEIASPALLPREYKGQIDRPLPDSFIFDFFKPPRLLS